MFRLPLIGAVCAAVLALPTGAAASTLDETYSSFLVFGDSLSDNGNLVPFGLAPPFPYFNGQFSNGPVWADLFAQQFGQSENFAFGGAEAAGGPTSFQIQTDLFVGESFSTDFGLRPLASVWFGANDLFATIGTADVAMAISQAAQAIEDGITRLIDNGVRDIIVFDLPDLGRTPLYNDLPPLDALATQATNDFNAALATTLVNLPDSARITSIDINDLVGDILADPAAFGLTNTTDACFDPSVGFFCGEQQNEYAFFDAVHPSATVHAEIAALAGATLEGDSGPPMSPIPLPAGAPALLLGLASLVVLRRRRASASS